MPRVLVVDDEENVRVLLRTYLKRNGYGVEVADSGESALAQVESFGPDFILTDVRMPRMGGLDLLTTLKAKGIEATVIVMSAYGNLDLAKLLINRGADANAFDIRLTGLSAYGMARAMGYDQIIDLLSRFGATQY